MVSPSETAVRLSRRRGTSVAPLLTVVLSLSIGCCPNTIVPVPVEVNAEKKKKMQFYCQWIFMMLYVTVPVQSYQ